MKFVNYLLSISLISILLITLISSKNINLKNDFVKINDTLFACKYEVSNKEYRLFLMDLLRTDQKEKYNKCLYDSNQWHNKFEKSFTEPMVKLYHSHPAYDYYPIVNITQYAAEMYCEWLTEINKKELNEKFKNYKQVKFCLPTELQWKIISSPLPGHNLPWYGNYLYENDKHHTILANVKLKYYTFGGDDYISDGSLFQIIRAHYKPNNFGIYDIIGNVAEMTKEGLIKGGSWFNYLEECTIDKTQKYDLPDPRVGFRIVLLVSKR